MPPYTFRWHGEARSVRVRGSIEDAGNADLRREGDEWSTTIELPADVRAVYWFALDGEDEWTRWLPDAANPNRYVYPAGLEFTGEREVAASMLVGPEAKPYEWTVERDVPRGALAVDRLDGRRVWRYTPTSPPEALLLLLFDGLQYTTLAAAPTVLDNLVAAGRIPPTAALLPDTLDTTSRLRDLGGESGFLAWACERLLPSAGVPAPRSRTLVAGSSMGGHASLRLVVERPDLFGGALVQSGGFPGMPVAVPPGLDLRFYLDVGVLEGDLRDSTRELRDDLLAKGYEVAYQEYPGGHDFFWWGETLADGLVALLG